jgi:hypothetical protein
MRRVYGALVLIPLLMACEGERIAGPNTYQEVITGTVSVYGTVQHPLTVSHSGNMTLRLTWSDASINLDLYLTGPACDGYPPVDCPLFAVSDAVGTTQESIQRTVSSGQEFKVWVDNHSQTQPSHYSLELRIE